MVNCSKPDQNQQEARMSVAAPTAFGPSRSREQRSVFCTETMTLLLALRDLCENATVSKLRRIVGGGQQSSLARGAGTTVMWELMQLFDRAAKVQELLDALDIKFRALLYDGTPKLIYDQFGEPTGEYTRLTVPINASMLRVRTSEIVNGISQLQAGWEYLELLIPYINALILVFGNMREAILANKDIEASMQMEVKVATRNRGEETITVEQCLEKTNKLFGFALSMLAERRSVRHRVQDSRKSSSVTTTTT